MRSGRSHPIHSRTPALLRPAAAILSLVMGLATLVSIGAAADDPLNLEALKGKVVYVDFWASWCVPCRHSFPWMNRMQSRFGQEGFVILAVDVDRVHTDAEQFLRDHAPNFRIVFDPEGRLAEQFGVKGMPSSILIDRAGEVRSRHEGFRLKERDALERQIESLMASR